MNKKGSKHIDWNDRLTIEKMKKVKSTNKQIAEAIGVCERTLYYELARGKCKQMTMDLSDLCGVLIYYHLLNFILDFLGKSHARLINQQLAQTES